MQVLMFGWEFPPHISGGLGTACLGLTQSLVDENVKLLFVVPTLFGNERAKDVHLINASKTIIPLPDDSKLSSAASQSKTSDPNRQVVRQSMKYKRRIRKVKETEHFTRVEIESGLEAYSEASYSTKSWTIEKWNYIFEKGPTNTFKTGNDKEQQESKARPSGYTYGFTGGYGPGLMDEVNQYALVATQLAKNFYHDVIHAHDWMTYKAGIAAKKVSKKPLIIHVHATEFDRSGRCGGPVFEIEKEGLTAADKIVAVSFWTKEILIRHYGINPAKIRVVHNGISASGNLATVNGSSIGSQVVTFLGRVTHQKGPVYFVEAARKVLQKFPNVHFIVAGAGDLLPQTIERVAQLKMSKHFHFTGFLNKDWIDKLWAMSSVYVMPSVSEPFGLTPLEAIQAGVPVIVSRQSGVSEVMPHALKVNFWDTEALAESICSVLKYESLSTMLKTKGEKEIKNLSWKKAANKIKRLYEEITA